MATSNMWSSPIFKKHIFPAEYAGNMPAKPVFWHFLEISSLVYSKFTKMHISNAHNMAESVFKENFFPAENTGNMPEIAIFAHFPEIISLYFVIFSCKNISYNNAHHQSWFNCQ